MASNPKEKLIDSAVRVFADKGYSGAKVADIVNGAGANIAAVNYHFGSKDKLFVCALRQAFADADEVYPSRGALSDDASAKDHIAAIARAILRRSFDDGKAGNFNKIMSRTMCVPGSPVEMILKEVDELELNHLANQLGQFLVSDDPTVISMAISNFIVLATIISKRPHGTQGLFNSDKPSPEEIDLLIEKQVSTIIATLSAFKSLTQQQAALGQTS